MRFLGAAVLGLAALLAIRFAQRDQAERHSILQIAGNAGLEAPTLAELEVLAAREVDPVDARLTVARKLLARAGAQPSAPLLEAVQKLARDSLAKRLRDPEALWILGAAIALERLASADPALITRYREWEQPLLDAVARGGSAAAEARPVLAAAYLATWRALSPTKKQFARELLQQVLADRETFHRLFESTVQALGGLEPILALVPDRSWAWQAVRRRALEEGQRAHWLEFESRELAASARERQEVLFDAERAVAKRQETRARQLLDPLWAALPVEFEQLDALKRLLSVRPAGPTSPERAHVAASWLELDRDLEHLERPGLPEDLRHRLFALARRVLPPHSEAELLLRLGERADAERLARRSERLWSVEWGRYQLLRAHLLFERGEPVAARGVLEEVPPEVRRSLSAALLVRRSNVPLETIPLEKPWVSLPSERRGRVTWEIWVPFGKAKLLLNPREPLVQEAFLQVYWNGRRLPWIVVPPGKEPVPLPILLESGAHLLEFGEGPESLRRGIVEIAPLPAEGGG